MSTQVNLSDNIIATGIRPIGEAAPVALAMIDKHTLRAADPAALGSALRPLLLRAYGHWEAAAGSAHEAAQWYSILVTAVQAEANSVDEMVALCAFALQERLTVWTEEARAALAVPEAHAVLSYGRDALPTAALVAPATAQEALRAVRHHFRDQAGLRGRQVMFPLRAAWTGTMVGPCLGVVASLLGAARCRQRIEDVLAWL